MKTKNKKKKKGKKIWIFLILVAVIIVGAVMLRGRGKGAKTIPAVQTVKAHKGDLQEEISSVGTVAGEEVTSIYAPASGTLKDVKARVGDEVKAGEAFITYDQDKLEDALYQAKLQNEKTQIAYNNTLESNSKGNGKVKEADVNLSVLEKQIADHEDYLKNLQKELSDYLTKESNNTVLENYNLKKKQAQLKEKLETLTPGTEEYAEAAKSMESVLNQMEQLTLKQSLTTKSDYQAELEKKIAQEQEAVAGFQEYKAKMEVQKSTGEASVLDDYGKRQLEIDKELTDISYRQLLDEAESAKKGISSEFQGVVTNLGVTPGGPVSAGMLVATVERTDRLKVKASATKYAMERLRIGQKVEAVIGERTFEGTVSHIDKIATVTNLNAASVAFEVELQGTDENVYLGMEAKMTIYTQKAENVLILPTEAVNANKDGDFVYAVQGGVIRIKPVKVGIVSKGMVQVLEGITESDDVVVKYGGILEDGMQVNAAEAGEG